MSTQPWTIGRDASIRAAHELMTNHQIRHLPVLDNGRLVGIVSERDLLVLEASATIDATTTRVDQAMTEAPFVVTGDTPMHDVVRIMGRHKYGSVVVMGPLGIVGIFTAVDACRALAEVLQRTVA